MSKKISFSNEQELAINARGENVLVSAGAGSGKTAVLTERIYRIAKENKTLDNFLVLTFTNLAANEMKDRTRKKLFDDPETKELATEVDNAHIETFDSFCLYLVKKYFYELGISKNLSIVDQTILTIKRKLILDELFENKCDEGKDNFLSLIKAYSVKDHHLIKDYVIKLLEESNKKADNYAYLNSKKELFNSPDFINKCIEDLYNEKQKTIDLLIKKAYELQDDNDSTKLLELFNSLKACKSYDELRKLLLVSKLPTKPSNKEVTDGEYRSAIKDIYDKDIKISSGSDYGSSQDIIEHYESTKQFAISLIDLAVEVEKELDIFKRSKNAYSFGDISRFVLTLFKNEHIRQEIKDSFDYIMIDEYQDTNDIQDTVINAISKNNVYMVGDVKQSIYRFRGADCSIFQEKYESYKKGIGGKEIDLNKSYRSRKEVVDFVNELFSVLMIKENNPIDYSNGHNFGFGREEYEINKPNCSYLPEVYNFSYEKSVEVPLKESNIIANDILKRIKDKFQVYDGEGKTRDCSYKDFAIIIDRGTDFDYYRRTFSEKGIPLKVESKEELFGSDVAVLIKNLVKMLLLSLKGEYGIPYKHCFMSIARSFIFNYTDDYLHEIVTEDKVLLVPFAQTIELIKEELRYKPIKKVLEVLYEKFEIYEHISRIASYYANTHKMENLLSLAGDMDVLGYTLEDFVNYFDDLNDADLEIDYRDSDTQENSVTLINIHGSKGLEYGIIYFPGLNKQFNDTDSKSSFMISDRYGVSIPSISSKFASLTNHLIREDIRQKDIEEKIRLLYVAITRAKEKIILLNGNKETGNKLTMRISSVRNMNSLISLSDVFNKYSVSYSMNNYSVEDKEQEEIDLPFEIKSINVPSELLVHNRASKVVEEDVNEAILDFGSELHAYLENMDLEKDDLSYIKDYRMRKYVSNVKNSSLFKDVKNEQVRHEYRFYDDENNVEGYIDALIIKEKEIDIIDFKLKKIDDEEYDKQLRTYKKYMSQITKLPVKMYLLAAITGEIREVKDE